MSEEGVVVISALGLLILIVLFGDPKVERRTLPATVYLSGLMGVSITGRLLRKDYEQKRFINLQNNERRILGPLITEGIFIENTVEKQDVIGSGQVYGLCKQHAKGHAIFRIK
ncbi:hypothetical protein DGG96_08445 [Legionella qingyii]|uniref:Uncharacterized protein n=1 Tax=Legionella qingyii TaxID=2184757 RepID=A0A317U6K4_9GAMM|nr:hypothetical protein DGG96_08445 [Legionella qingyii]